MLFLSYLIDLSDPRTCRVDLVTNRRLVTRNPRYSSSHACCRVWFSLTIILKVGHHLTQCWIILQCNKKGVYVFAVRSQLNISLRQCSHFPHNPIALSDECLTSVLRRAMGFPRQPKGYTGKPGSLGPLLFCCLELSHQMSTL